MSATTWLRALALTFLVALVQVVVVSSIVIGGGSPDLLLVTVVALGLLRGSIPGAVLGFVGGIVVDVATLGTLGVTSLVLTLAGFWSGRYGETTGRDRRVAGSHAAERRRSVVEVIDLLDPEPAGSRRLGVPAQRIELVGGGQIDGREEVRIHDREGGAEDPDAETDCPGNTGGKKGGAA